MPIFISTKKATLKTDDAKYYFTSSNDSLTEEEFITSITQETGLKTKEDAAKAYYAIKRAAIKMLKRGYRVPLFFGDFYLAAKGSAESEDEPFTPTFTKAHNHHFELRFSQNLDKKDALFDNVYYKRIKAPKKKPFEPKIKSVNVINTTTMLIEGIYLNHDILDTSTGIFLKNRTDSFRLLSSNIGTKNFYATLSENIKDGDYHLVFVNHRKNGTEIIEDYSPYCLKIGDNTIIRQYYENKKDE